MNKLTSRIEISGKTKITNNSLPRNPATMPIVVGRLAAHTPSLFKVFSSIFDATMSGGAHYNEKVNKHYVGTQKCSYMAESRAHLV